MLLLLLWAQVAIGGFLGLFVLDWQAAEHFLLPERIGLWNAKIASLWATNIVFFVAFKVVLRVLAVRRPRA